MTLRMQKNMLNFVNIDGHAFSESLRYAFLTKFDQQISDMTAMTVLTFDNLL